MMSKPLVNVSATSKIPTLITDIQATVEVGHISIESLLGKFGQPRDVHGQAGFLSNTTGPWTLRCDERAGIVGP